MDNVRQGGPEKKPLEKNPLNKGKQVTLISFQGVAGGSALCMISINIIYVTKHMEMPGTGHNQKLCNVRHMTYSLYQRHSSWGVRWKLRVQGWAEMISNCWMWPLKVTRILKVQAHNFTVPTLEISIIVVECQSQHPKSTLWCHCWTLASHLPFQSPPHSSPLPTLGYCIGCDCFLVSSNWSSLNESDHITSAHNPLVATMMANLGCHIFGKTEP